MRWAISMLLVKILYPAYRMVTSESRFAPNQFHIRVFIVWRGDAFRNFIHRFANAFDQFFKLNPGIGVGIDINLFGMADMMNLIGGMDQHF